MKRNEINDDSTASQNKQYFNKKQIFNKKAEKSGLVPEISRNLEQARDVHSLVCKVRDLLTGSSELKGEANAPDPSGLTARVAIATDIMQTTVSILQQILEELN